ncbi:unnamed protein product [Arabidopsis lyrata]|uniref:Uncharacterized protein n=1 Tax=Arabidopsis lyrata subsp. lyrata TaxID=81972 RepID=D7LEE4_ARALL|nr:hypothetical protein ARALYDRAFT_903266 [Arabidopsis lyrata subsp. lyrata]CAH8265376.1 unnamed protein product [Arabidopsis lyrata]
MTYTISLMSITTHRPWRVLFKPMVVSKQVNLFFYDSKKRLFKYYPETYSLCCLSLDICVISPFVENLFSLNLSSGFHYVDHASCSRISKFFRPIEFLFSPCILLTTALASLVIVV